MDTRVGCTQLLWTHSVGGEKVRTTRLRIGQNCRVVCTNFSGSFLVSISSDVSLRYEGSFLTCGGNHLSTNWDIHSVILLQLDMRGLIPSIHPLLEHGSFIGLWFTTLYLFISPVESRCSAAICTGKEAVGSWKSVHGLSLLLPIRDGGSDAVDIPDFFEQY